MVSDYEFKKMVGLFRECLKDSGFEREKELITADIFISDKKEKWLIVAAGIDRPSAEYFFKRRKNYIEQAMTPLNIPGGEGSASICLTLRPASHSERSNVVCLSEEDGIPWVEIRSGYIKVWGIRSNTCRLENFRWDFESESDKEVPKASYLQEWTKRIGFNPGHAPSHLHINSQSETYDLARKKGRAERSAPELRLAVGIPNPLAFILSLSAWLHSIR